MSSGKDKALCTACGNEKPIRDFYVSYSPFHKATGKITVCKKCVNEAINIEEVKKGNLSSLLNLLRGLDKPFIFHLYESAISRDPFIGQYFQLIHSKDFRHLTWDDSDFEGHKNSKSISQNNHSMFSEEEIEDSDMKTLIQFFGKGFETEDYVWLQNEYEDFLNRYECDSKGMELLIKEICLQQLDIQKRRANGEKVDQQLKTLQDLLGSSNLKPVQETGANAVEQESFGTLIKKFENEKPIPEPSEQWKDVDGISKYLKIWFLGHLARMVGLENPYQKEYDEEIKKYKIELDEEEDDEDVIL